jgi:hypothetical protein
MRAARRNCGLVVMIVAALGCGGGGAAGDQPPGGTVPTPAVALSDAQATETASAAALSMLAALRVLADDVPGVAAADGTARAMGGPAQAATCNNGGALLATCRAGGGRAVVTTRAIECELLDAASGHRVTVDGEVRATVQAPDVCRRGEIPAMAARTYRYVGFQAVVRDAQGIVETLGAPRLTQVVQPFNGGCGSGQADTTLTGRLRVQRRDGTDVRIDTVGLRLARRLDGSPCAARVSAVGVAAITDQAGNRAVRVAFDGVTLSGGAGTGYHLDGEASLACAGAYSFSTEAPVVLAGACPLSGALRLHLPSGTTALSVFDDGSVRLDANGDGTAERSVESCSGLALTGCS